MLEGVGEVDGSIQVSGMISPEKQIKFDVSFEIIFF